MPSRPLSFDLDTRHKLTLHYALFLPAGATCFIWGFKHKKIVQATYLSLACRYAGRMTLALAELVQGPYRTTSLPSLVTRETFMTIAPTDRRAQCTRSLAGYTAALGDSQRRSVESAIARAETYSPMRDPSSTLPEAVFTLRLIRYDDHTNAQGGRLLEG